MHFYCNRNQRHLKTEHFHMTPSVLRSVVLWQHLDDKMPDQRLAKRRDFGIFTGQMAVPPLLLSCHWATTGGSLEAETYAIQHARSAVQLVAWKHPSETKHRNWQNTHRQEFAAHCAPACLSIYGCKFPDLHHSLNVAWGERDISLTSTGVCTFRYAQPLAVCFIHLLNSCQVTPIFRLQRKCVFSLRRRKS